MIPVIDTIKPMGDFPVVEAENIQLDGKKLDEVLKEIASKEEKFDKAFTIVE